MITSNFDKARSGVRKKIGQISTVIIKITSCYTDSTNIKITAWQVVALGAYGSSLPAAFWRFSLCQRADD
jgi:hypothetical protein